MPPAVSLQPDRTWIEVDRAALKANAQRIMQAAPRARLVPMVKADAYGLGAVPVAQALEPLDPWGFGVATAAEGAALRAAGVVRPVLVVQPTLPMLEACAAQGLTPVLGTPREIGAWLSLGTLPFHVGVDTGMNRGGLWWEAVAGTAASFARAPGFEGIATHFHSADTNPASVREQWQRFEAAIAALPERPRFVHAANSAATLGHPEVHGDLVRPGIFLYGGCAGAHEPEPVVTWKARVCRVARREAGATVSYGERYQTHEPTTIVTVAAGYADGVRRSLAEHGAMLLGGRPMAIAGAVTMDFTMLHTNGTVPDDAVATIIGEENGSRITLDGMAQAAGTISYEILTGLGPRVERIYR
jgi:alanine racemase